MDNRDRYIGQFLDNRYELLEVIGRGGMAVVYKARCHRLNRLVAVKILKDEFAVDEDFRRRFHTESQAVAMLSHPNIMTVYDVSRSQDCEYIVMELLEGITLKQYMQRKGVLTWKEALHFATQITKALSHAHSRGIIHRDIKPHNIMILRDGSVKVADFGIARLRSRPNTLTQEALGSVHYMSPEQAKGAEVDERSDIYSVGVVMYEMLTGRLPFEGDSPVSIAIQHISSIPLMPRELNEDIPVSLEKITMHAMNPDLDTRYSSANELLEDLEEFRKNPEAEFDFQSAERIFGPESDVHDIHTEQKMKSEEEEEAPEETEEPVRVKKKKKTATKEEYYRNVKNTRKVATLTALAVVLAFLVAAALFLWRSFGKEVFVESETAVVPNLVGKTLAAVEQNSDYTDAYKLIVTEEYNADYPEGYIFEQSPIAGRTIVVSDEKANMELKVSKGGRFVTVPNLINLDYRRAQTDLKKVNLENVVSYETSDTVTEGYVISTIPAHGEELSPGETVYLIVSLGPEVKTVEVPSVVGMPLEEAKRRLELYNLKPGNVLPVESTEPAGTVLAQNPVAETEVFENQQVNLEVSLGPKKVVVPGVVGMTQAAAEAAITGVGLNIGTVTSASSELYPAGTVCEQSVIEGTELDEGSYVNIVISTGPEASIEPEPPLVNEGQEPSAPNNGGIG